MVPVAPIVIDITFFYIPHSVFLLQGFYILESSWLLLDTIFRLKLKHLSINILLLLLLLLLLLVVVVVVVVVTFSY
jgi:hypothetical protein